MQTEWIAVDWGTSNLRVWVFGPGCTEIARRTSPKGMGTLPPEAFEAALLDLVTPYLAETHVTPVIVCGMAGARQGWAEAPYAAVPCPPPGIDLAVRAPVRDARLSVFILPGLRQARPADVMRGEETQIAGYLAASPDFDGVLCLPGTHTKWARISAGEIVSFQTFMTGELHALLSGQSVLRHAVEGGGWDDDAFAAAISDAMSAPQMIGARLFGLRAGALLDGLSSGAARARLSGLLIGLELAGARPYWLGQDVAIIGTGELSALYATALAAQGLQAPCRDGAELVLTGLKDAYAKWKGQTNAP